MTITITTTANSLHREELRNTCKKYSCEGETPEEHTSHNIQLHILTHMETNTEKICRQTYVSTKINYQPTPRFDQKYRKGKYQLRCP